MLQYFIFGLIILILLVLAILIKNWNKKIQGEWILAGFLIGIISILINLFISPLLEILIRLFLIETGLAQIIAMLLIFVVLSVVYTYFRKESGAFFAKTLVVSFLGAALLVIIGLFLAGQGAGGILISIEEVKVDPALDKFKYAELKGSDLDDYPELKTAFAEYMSTGKLSTRIDYEQQNKISNFLQTKERRTPAEFYFIIPDASVEEDLKKGFSSQKLKSIFGSKGFNLSENPRIYSTEIGWDIIDNTFLFNINDYEIERDLKRIGQAPQGQIIENRINKIKELFRINGILLSDNYNIFREPERWVLIDDNGKVFEIREEKGKLNVYTGEEKLYEIRKENGELNVYDGKNYPFYLKFGEKYYRIGILHED